MKAGNNKKGKKKATPGGQKRLAAIAAKLRFLFLGIVPVLAAAGVIYLLFQSVPSAFRVKAVELSGNEHLTDEELKQVIGLKGNESLLTLSGRKVYEKLKGSPWIQAVSVRKEHPSKLLIRIRETEPFALLDMKGKMFIVDDRGKLLEELKDNSVPFLPVILSDPYHEKEAFREAVNLAKAIKIMGVLHRSQRIEIIAHQPNEIAADLDGVFVKVGAGDYEEKLARFLQIEDEIRKRNITVASIDLRFAKKVIVKPVHEVIR